MIYSLAWTLFILLTIQPFFSSNDNLIETHDSIQQKNFNKFLTECKPKQDVEKVIFNFSNFSLTEVENHF